MRTSFSAAVLLFLILSAALILWFAPYDFATQDRDATMAAPSARHLTGTDALGRDRAVRVAAALLIGITGSTTAAAVTTMIATGFGLLAAFSPAWAAASLMFVSDAFLSMPWLFLLMMARSVLPLTATPLASAVATFLVLAALGWPACAKAIYSGARTLSSSESIIHGRAGGLKRMQLIRLHFLPHLLPLLLPQFLITIPAFIVAEANLGALGLGIGEPVPSWGGMLLELDNSATIARSHMVYLPIVLLVAVLLLLESFTREVETDA